MPGPADFTKFVPGFDFLQGLVKTAGQTLPGMGQWIAPSLDPKELEKRIEQLRTVQFWLEQNARLLGAAIQALEVQRMTLSTLQSMNVPMDGLREAFTLRPGAGAPSAPTPAASAAQVREQAPEEPPEEMPEEDAAEAPAPAAAAAAGVDPMQWWGALTQQFTHLAAQALKDNAPEMARPLTDRMAEGMERAGAAVAGAPAPAGAAAGKKAAKKAAKSATTKTAKAAPKKAARAPAPTGSGSRAATPASPRRARR